MFFIAIRKPLEKKVPILTKTGIKKTTQSKLTRAHRIVNLQARRITFEFEKTSAGKEVLHRMDQVNAAMARLVKERPPETSKAFENWAFSCKIAFNERLRTETELWEEIIDFSRRQSALNSTIEIFKEELSKIRKELRKIR